VATVPAVVLTAEVAVEAIGGGSDRQNTSRSAASPVSGVEKFKFFQGAPLKT
jgi:hypothetical protein